MQGSTEDGIGPNFKKGRRIPRTAESVKIFKGECGDPWTVDLVRILKGIHGSLINNINNPNRINLLSPHP